MAYTYNNSEVISQHVAQFCPKLYSYLTSCIEFFLDKILLDTNKIDKKFRGSYDEETSLPEIV